MTSLYIKLDNVRDFSLAGCYGEKCLKKDCSRLKINLGENANYLALHHVCEDYEVENEERTDN